MIMMMIVDLHSALCKAPLLCYVSWYVVKKNVFSDDRKDPMLSDLAKGCIASLDRSWLQVDSSNLDPT